MSETAVHELETLLADQPKSPLRPAQRDQYEEEMQRLSAQAQAPDFLKTNRGRAAKQLKDLQRMVESQTAHVVTEPILRDKIARKSEEVLGMIRNAMLPREVMRRNPAGAVSQFFKRENSTLVKRATAAWKRSRYALERPSAQDPDFSNIEVHRPEMAGHPDGRSTFMADAQIPGKFAQTPLSKENWPLGEPTATTALGAVKAAEARPERAKKVWTDAERKAAGDRLKKAREAKKAAQ